MPLPFFVMESEMPTPPTNVRLVFGDGHRLAVSCTYVGLDGEGQHVWRVVGAPRWRRVAAIQVGTLPPNTTVIVGRGRRRSGGADYYGPLG